LLEFETEAASAEILFHVIEREPSAVQFLRNGSASVRPGEGVNHKIIGVREQLDKEARQSGRESSRVNLDAVRFALHCVLIIGGVVS
jgi:hypothetical protein